MTRKGECLLKKYWTYPLNGFYFRLALCFEPCLAQRRYKLITFPLHIFDNQRVAT